MVRLEGVVVNVSAAGFAFVSAHGGRKATHFAHKYGLERAGIDFAREGMTLRFTEAPPKRAGLLPVCHDIDLA